MSKTENTAKRRVRAQAMDDEYKQLEEFKVDRRRIVMVDDESRGSGRCGVVRRAELHHSAYIPAWLASRHYGPPQVVAIKQIKIPAADNMLDLKRAFAKRVLVWSQLQVHPGIAKFLGFHADFKRGEAWLLSPWEPNGNISEFLRAHDLEVPEKLSLVYDTIEALDFLHQLDPPICHGGIKSANVLVNAKFKAVLCDFSLERLYEDSGFERLETSSGLKGPIHWCSPEILDGAARVPASDVYAWAWLAWEIMTGEISVEDTSVDYAIIRQIFESPVPQIDGESRLKDCLRIWELLRRCWRVDPAQRPTARTCKTTVTYLPRCTPTLANADHQTRSAALSENLGDLESWKGNHVASVAYFNEALRLYQEEANTKGIAIVLRKQAAAANRHSDYGTAVATATTAIDYCRALNDILGIVDASFTLGDSLMAQDRLDEALPILRESLEICQAHGIDVGAAQVLERIGEIQRLNSQGEMALATLDEAVAAASRSGDRLGMARALRTVAFTLDDLSDFVGAADACSEANKIARNIGWDQGLTESLWLMGTLKMRSGEYREAEELFRESVSISRQRCLRWPLAWGLMELGRCFQKQSRLDEAAASLEESCFLYQELSKQEHSKNVASALVKLKSRQGEWDRALFWHDHIIAVCRSQKQHMEVAAHLEQKGQILAKVRRYDEAALHFEAAIVTYAANGYPCDWELEQLCAVPNTAMKWERRSPLLCDVKRLQRRLPQLATASLKFPVFARHREP